MATFPPNPPNLKPAAFCTQPDPERHRQLARRQAALAILTLIGSTLAVTIACILLASR